MNDAVLPTAREATARSFSALLGGGAAPGSWIDGALVPGLVRLEAERDRIAHAAGADLRTSIDVE